MDPLYLHGNSQIFGWEIYRISSFSSFVHHHSLRLFNKHQSKIPTTPHRHTFVYTQNIYNLQHLQSSQLQISKVPPFVEHSSRILIQKLGNGSEVLIIEGHVVRVSRRGKLRDSRHEGRLLARCCRNRRDSSGWRRKRRSCERWAHRALEAICRSDVLHCRRSRSHHRGGISGYNFVRRRGKFFAEKTLSGSGGSAWRVEDEDVPEKVLLAAACGRRLWTC